MTDHQIIVFGACALVIGVSYFLDWIAPGWAGVIKIGTDETGKWHIWWEKD